MSKKKKPILERQNRTSFKALESKAVHAETAKELVNVETKEAREEETSKGVNYEINSCTKSSNFIGDHELFAYCKSDEPLNLEWMSNFFEMDESWFHFT